MRITNRYSYDGKVCWRVFADYDPLTQVGLKEGLLSRDESADYEDGPFVQLEFKKDWFWGDEIRKPQVFYIGGNVELRQDGSTYQRPGDWTLPKTEYTEWMDAEKIQRRTLFEITLPKTHDAGSWQLSRRLIKDNLCGLPLEFPDAALVALAIVPTYPDIAAVFQKMAITQSRSVSQQLNEGIRAFDLRALCCPPHNEFCTAHGLLGAPISYVLGEIKQFLDRTRREVILLELGAGSTIDDQNWAKLRNLIDGIFGNRLVPTAVSLENTTLDDLTRDIGSRVIIVSNRDGYRKDLVAAEPWDGGTMSMEKLKQGAAEHIEDSQREKDKLVGLSWCLTPQRPSDEELEKLLEEIGVPAAVISGLLPFLGVAGGVIALFIIITIVGAFSKDLLPKLLPKLFVDLRDVAAKANRELEDFVKDLENRTGKKRINLIATDHYDTSPAVRMAVERSMS